MEDLIKKIENEKNVNNIIKILSEIIEKISLQNINLQSDGLDIVIVNSLDNPSDLVRIKATELAEYSKNEIVVKKLIEKLKNDSNYFVRGFAAKALGSIGNIIAKEALEAATSDNEGFVTSFASQALKTINVKLTFSSKLDSLRAKLQVAKK